VEGGAGRTVSDLQGARLGDPAGAA